MNVDPIHPWRTRREDRSRGPLALILSVVGHFAFLGLLLFLSHVHIGAPERRAPAPLRAVTLRGVTPQQWAKNRGQSVKDPFAQRSSPSQPAPPPPPEPPRKKKETLPNGQVVDVAPGNGEEAPDAKYLAESANRAK